VILFYYDVQLASDKSKQVSLLIGHNFDWIRCWGIKTTIYVLILLNNAYIDITLIFTHSEIALYNNPSND